MAETISKRPSLVVGVGASAGGLQAYKELLSVLPADGGMAFVFVQHLDPGHDSHLADLLAPRTKMAVVSAEQGQPLEPNTVYVIRPGTSLAVRDGRLQVTEPTLHRGVRLPVDHLFRSLAREYTNRSAGIVLSGAGSDGSAGMQKIKSFGGLTIAQTPRSSQQSGMPVSAIDTGVIDLVLDIQHIPAALERFQRLPHPARVQPATEVDQEPPQTLHRLTPADMDRVAQILGSRSRFDVRVYKAATVERRVLRRAALAGCPSLEDYVQLLHDEPAEQGTLIQDLLISVTDFFRDRQAYSELRERALEPLVRGAAPGDTLRVWVPGCATGEEAYSIGMLMLDAIEHSQKRISLQMFATDVDETALEVARTGLYPPDIVDHVPGRQLGDYFKPLDGRGHQVRPQLRDRLSFAVHDLTRDPPFSRMDLVSCRNLLIYLTPETQRDVLGALHFSLREKGYLFLGSSESTERNKDLFSAVCKRHRIYRKLGSSRPGRPRPRGQPGSEGAQTLEPQDGHTPSARRRTSDQDSARRAVLDAWVPPTVIVASGDHVRFVHGDLGPFMQFPQGEDLTFELSSLLRPAVATRARTALYRCRRNRQTVRARTRPESGAGPAVQITARPAPQVADDAVMLTFEALDATAHPASDPGAAEQQTAIVQLEAELQATREDLRNTIEELESANEELRSSHEESMSMNEELQSSNEELEATTEELRSLNEELSTVNAQLKEKVAQLERANDDLNNFFASTKLATVFLDERLRIQRFTPPASALLHIDFSDANHRISEITRELLQHELEREAKLVLDDFQPRSREIELDDGRTFDRQVLPYQTENRRVAGVVVTYAEVTDIKWAQAARLASERELLKANRRKDEFIAMLGHELRNPLASIRSATELIRLLEGPDPRVARAQRILERQSSHMARLLDGLLDISRIVEGKIALERERFDFTSVCRNVVGDAGPRLSAKNLTLHQSLPGEPIWIDGDPARLTQVVDNLLTNAIKYSRQGGQLWLGLAQDDEQLELELRDEGVGIEPDLLPHIFDAFLQSEQDIDRSEGGMGIGLALVKTLTELHGGRVRAHSQGRGFGARFQVHLPLAPEPSPSAARSGEAASPMKILVVEDNEDAAEMMRQVLEVAGHEVRCAYGGKQALQVAQQERPQVVLCDLGLPDLPGFDVARRIRAHPELSGTRLVAITGYGRTSDKSRAREAGFDSHLTKPVNFDQLRKVLTAHE